MRYSLSVLFKSLFITFLIVISPFLNNGLEAGPFLKIDEIYDKKFPKLKVFLTVKDLNKNIIKGLDEENITLYEDGFLVNYVRVKNISETNDSLHIVISIDSSKSISAELLNKIKKSANDFLSHSGSRDLNALYRFNDEVKLLNSFTNNRADLVRNINKINRHGSKTLLYNALYDSIDILNKTDSIQKAVIVFTDGKDEGSSIEINDIIALARDAHIPIYCIAYNPKDREKSLSRLSKLTGGVLYNSNKKNISDIYDTILSTIRNQYVIEYKSMIEPDGKAHIIEARLKYDNIRDREQKEITFKKQLPFFKFTYDNEFLIIALIVFLIILLIIFIFSLKHFNKAIKSSVKTQDNISRKVIYEDDYDDSMEEITSKTAAAEDAKEEKREEIIDLKAWLVERDGVNAGRKIPIQHEETTIGKNKNNRIVIDDRSAAGDHAKIKLIKNAFYLFDMASGKGTFLNENKLLRPKLLYDWDEIKIGKKVYIFRISNIA